MTVSSANVVIGLQYWFGKFLFESSLNKNQIPYPSKIRDTYFDNDRSFIRLLFDDNWPSDYTYYYYMFNEYSISTTSPPEVSRRISIYPSPKIYIAYSDGNINFFNLKNDDLFMLDKLLDYRISDGTSVYDIEIDSTAVYETILSNLIHTYLDLMINGNKSNFSNSNIICNDLLTCLYEIYLTEKMFNYISDTGFS